MATPASFRDVENGFRKRQGCSGRHPEADGAALGELSRVGVQVEQDAAQPVWVSQQVARQRFNLRSRVRNQRVSLCFRAPSSI